MSGREIEGYHATRLAHDARRTVLWRTLVEAYFAKMIPLDGCVLELGCGHCDFINHVRARRRVALDMWPGFQAYAAPGVETVVAAANELDFLEDGAVNFVFASNLFEHLHQSDFAKVLSILRRKMAPGGTINILQPNYRYCAPEYFDDYTHVAVWSHVSLADFLAAHGFDPVSVTPRFLPLTIKSRLPVWPAMIRAYLASPVKPMGKQMLLRARLRG
jgi:SAM-dependent methyltransferase